MPDSMQQVRDDRENTKIKYTLGPQLTRGFMDDSNDSQISHKKYRVSLNYSVVRIHYLI
jgi:hypothetical protein